MATVVRSSDTSDANIPRRLLGCVAAFFIVPLWASGAMGQALSLEVVLALFVSLIALPLVITTRRLDSALRVALVISAGSVAIVVADTALRIWGSTLVFYRAHSELLRKDLSYPSLPRYVGNAYSSREIFGDLAAISGNPDHRVARWEIFQTDPFGFRNSPSDLKPPHRVVVLGDSFGMGLGVSQDKHWAALLKLDRIPVYNLSMPSTCAAHGAARLTLELVRLNLPPGATIIAPVYTGNDVDECGKSVDELLAEGPQSWWKRGSTAIEDYRSRSPLRQLGMRLVYRFLFSDPVVTVRNVPPLGDILFYTPHDKAARLSERELLGSHKFDNLKHGLLRIKSLADSHQGKVLVVLIPPKEEVYDWMLHYTRPWEPSGQPSEIARAIRSVCEENDLDFIDLTPSLISEAKRALGRGEMLWWRDDSHWNPEGHRVAARIIEETLNQ